MKWRHHFHERYSSALEMQRNTQYFAGLAKYMTRFFKTLNSPAVGNGLRAHIIHDLVHITGILLESGSDTSVPSSQNSH